MTTTKWILCVIAASVTSSYATLNLHQTNHNELSATSVIENFNHPQSSNINPTEQRQEAVTTTISMHDTCEPPLNQPVQHHADTDANNVIQTQPPRFEDLQSAYEKKQNEMTSFREFIQRTGDGALSVISKNYDAEPLDPEWARLKEDELLAILDTNETLQNTAPLELSCKSQNCRLILSEHDGNRGESLYSAFKEEALQGRDENKKQVISYFKNPDSGEIHIYLSKNTVNTLLDGKMD